MTASVLPSAIVSADTGHVVGSDEFDTDPFAGSPPRWDRYSLGTVCVGWLFGSLVEIGDTSDIDCTTSMWFAYHGTLERPLDISHGANDSWFLRWDLFFSEKSFTEGGPGLMYFGWTDAVGSAIPVGEVNEASLKIILDYTDNCAYIGASFVFGPGDVIETDEGFEACTLSFNHNYFASVLYTVSTRKLLVRVWDPNQAESNWHSWEITKPTNKNLHIDRPYFLSADGYFQYADIDNVRWDIAYHFAPAPADFFGVALLFAFVGTLVLTLIGANWIRRHGT